MAFGGDPDWLYDLDQEKRIRVMGYLLARRKPGMGFGSIAGLTLADLADMLSHVTKSQKKKGGKKDLMAGLMDQLWDDTPDR